MLLAFIFSSFFVHATEFLETPHHHLWIDLSGHEYEKLLAKEALFTSKYSAVEEAIQVGGRNLEWLKYINSFLEKDKRWDLTPKEDVRNYPMTKPGRYSPKTVETTHKNLFNKMPQEMVEVIFENKPFKIPTLNKKTFIFWSKKVDRNYQGAARWKITSRYLNSYIRNRQRDIRGYYFLSQEPNLKEKLEDWSQLEPKKREKLFSWLKMLCYNTHRSSSLCEKKLDKSIGNHNVYSFYKRYLNEAERIYNEFFSLQHIRGDISWSSHSPEKMILPFRTVNDLDVKNFLIDNIEEEWRWDHWQLKLYFKNSALASIHFAPGVAPHVLNNNLIVMDSNSSLEAWNTRWTIRHELGHVLGFKDCYVEFYDEEAEEMVNYQIDTSNIMCSRTGVFSQTHYDVLKEAYFKD